MFVIDKKGVLAYAGAIDNSPDGEKRIREIYGERVVVIPYIMAGFDLAAYCAREFPKQAGKNTVGMVLLSHGIFSFGPDARSSYELMIELVSMAEEYHDQGILPQEITELKELLERAYPKTADGAALKSRVYIELARVYMRQDISPMAIQLLQDGVTDVTGFTDAEIDRFLANMQNVEGATPRHVPGRVVDDGPVNQIINLSDADLDRWFATHAYDVRPETREQAESLGAKFVKLKTTIDATGAGGYARELTPEERAAQQAELNEIIGGMDVVITTAQVPGRKPPVLVTVEAVDKMKPGSVIVDARRARSVCCKLSRIDSSHRTARVVVRARSVAAVSIGVSR